jgi:hypothetical protein
VTTSPEALSDWKHLGLPYEWILCYEDEIVDIDAVAQKVQPQLEALLRDHLVVMDCSSSTKPATIAFYELARMYLVPLVYVQETTRRLKWLISKNDILKEVGLATYEETNDDGRNAHTHRKCYPRISGHFSRETSSSMTSNRLYTSMTTPTV